EDSEHTANYPKWRILDPVIFLTIQKTKPSWRQRGNSERRAIFLIFRYTFPMATPKETRAAAAKAKAADIRARKLHVIAERRAKAAKMEKSEFIAEIVKGKFPPITQEDLENEPTPEAPG